MRMFARFQTPEQHDAFVTDLLKAKEIRDEIAQLQVYSQMGLTTMAQVTAYVEAREVRMWYIFIHDAKLANCDNASLVAGPEKGH